MKETVATLGLLLFFAGAMIAISGSSFITQGGLSAARYFQVGIIEIAGMIITMAGLALIVKSR